MKIFMSDSLTVLNLLRMASSSLIELSGCLARSEEVEGLLVDERVAPDGTTAEGAGLDWAACEESQFKRKRCC